MARLKQEEGKRGNQCFMHRSTNLPNFVAMKYGTSLVFVNRQIERRNETLIRMTIYLFASRVLRNRLAYRGLC